MFIVNGFKIVSNFQIAFKIWKSTYFLSTQKIQETWNLNCNPLARILVYLLLTEEYTLYFCINWWLISHIVFISLLCHMKCLSTEVSVLWTVTLYWSGWHRLLVWCSTYVWLDPFRFLQNSVNWALAMSSSPAEKKKLHYIYVKNRFFPPMFTHYLFCCLHVGFKNN